MDNLFFILTRKKKSFKVKKLFQILISSYNNNKKREAKTEKVKIFNLIIYA